MIAAGGSGRSAGVIPAVPAAWSVTTIAFMGIISSISCLFDGRGDVQHFGDPDELETEDIVQDEGHPLQRAQLLHDQEHRRADGLVDEDRLGCVRPRQQGFRQPRPYIRLPASPGGNGRS
ncbi:hypothetical protein MPTA5024_27385 [Microbispora sp. ATCC PTA-5024]|nr:hypothetical protein MPTA5024_27385 [Microbispora sp. ATCC PTA-5024]